MLFLFFIFKFFFVAIICFHRMSAEFINIKMTVQGRGAMP